MERPTVGRGDMVADGDRVVSSVITGRSSVVTVQKFSCHSSIIQKFSCHSSVITVITVQLSQVGNTFTP